MGYITERVTVTQSNTRTVGATCDRCGCAFDMGRFGPVLASMIRVRPSTLHIHSGTDVPDLLFCLRCFDAVLKQVPEVQAAIDRANGGI